MKRLVLIRHAKSSWDDPQQRDFDRLLNRRGARDAPHMGHMLAEQGIRPDRFLSSPACRALTTARMIARAIGFPEAAIEEAPGIYEASPDTLLQLLRNQHDHDHTIALTGHNPGLTMLANRLGTKRIDNIPTCGIVIFTLSDSWAGLGGTPLETEAFLYPKRH